MKAWYLSVKDSDEGERLVFANTRNEARAQADSNNMFYDSWIEIEARRAPSLDDKDNLPKPEIDLYLWREKGWQWLDIDTPDEANTTDEQFYQWHNGNFGSHYE